jgi:PadR family transcriptional regulator PadR
MVAGLARNPVSELRRGVLEYCVLAIVDRGERYAFDIIHDLAAHQLLTSEGTIYPLLARLRRDEMVTTSWRESELGPPRRYYRLTDAGRRALAAFAQDWNRFKDAVDDLMGASEGGQGAR